MPTILAPELWAQILAFLSYASLDVVKRVNRVFYRISRVIILEVLDLIPTINGDNRDEQLEILEMRLSLARSHPHLIKKLCFVPMAQFSLFNTLDPLHPKPVPLLKRIFGKAKEGHTPITRSKIESVYLKVIDIESTLKSLLPSFTSLEELDMSHPSSWNGIWGPNTELALRVSAIRLTVLSLRLSFTLHARNYPEVFNLALPALHTLRVMLNIGAELDNHHESRIQKIIYASPLLRDIHWHILSYGVRDIVYATRVRTPTYLRLKVFKWTTIRPSIISDYVSPSNALPISLPTLFISHAFQFEVVHLNPAPSFDALLALNIGQLVELRVDLNGRDDGELFFNLIARAGRLVTLEVTGIRYWNVANDPCTLFPGVGLGSLRRLHLGIALEFFNARSLKNLALKLPRLHKLVLLIEPWNNRIWTRISVQAKCEALLYEFHGSTVNQGLSEWELLDLGVIFRDWTGKIIDFEGLLRAISRKVSSIRSFYGTGSLDLWDGMEDEIEENWGGELWNQRKGSW
ncbi:hypothetical protein DL96DRAFT_1635829 [Flagelloscypha sp. PMI_526]|nr:hypothetical protein DL96DRAFT_1635829 [Flagelloscypha sp. PMI_526]